MTAVPGVTQKASPSTKAEFDELINGTGIDEAELQREREKTNRCSLEKTETSLCHLDVTKMSLSSNKKQSIVDVVSFSGTSG